MAIRGLIAGLFTPSDIIVDGLSSAFTAAEVPAGLSFLHTLVEWDLDAGTVYASYVGTSSPTQFYEGRVLSISQISREVPMECGLYSVGNVDVVLDNSDRYLSHRKASEAWRNRTVRILLGYPDLGISTFEPAFTGVVTDVAFDGSTVRLTLTDDVMARFNIPITEVLKRVTPGGYPDATPDDARPDLIPYLAGTIEKPTNTDDTTLNVGQIPARRINGSDFIYVIGHGEISIIDLYVYGVRTNSGWTDSLFTASGGEVFTIVTFDNDPRNLVDHTAEEFEVTWNGFRLDAEFRPLYEAMNFLVDRCGFSSSEFDTAELSEHAAAMDDRNIQGAWAIVDTGQMVADVIEEFLNSHACRMCRKRDGTLSFKFLGTSATAVEDFRESHEILDGSFRISMNRGDTTASRLQLNFDWNYARQFYARQPDLNSPSEEANLVYAKRRNRSLRYVRSIDGDDSPAIAIGALYFQLMRENVQLVEFDVPARFFSAIELGDVVTVTHTYGIGADGYDEQRVVVLATEIDPEPTVARIHIRGYIAEEPETDTVELSATFTLSGDLEVVLEAV